MTVQFGIHLPLIDLGGRALMARNVVGLSSLER
jgi:hypothetical protein